ncbi:ABC transporter permease [Amorphus sp. 3PC139-8]|uniref:ABC transporter permease n=1 Tax=Amorphus sp. 3PC139-8 TaxID=2735676 RepID=UPI00345DFC1C
MRVVSLLLARVAKRLLAALPAIAGVLVLTFVLLRVLPGDPASLYATSPSAGEAEIAAIQADLGLDRPLPEQFWIYLRDLARGDLGTSLMTGRPVVADLARRLPASLELIAAAFALALLVSLPLGIAAALRPHSLVDLGARVLATVGIAVPTFVTGLVLIEIFYVLFGWAPDPTGRLDIFLIPPEQVTGFLGLDALIAGDHAAFSSALAKLVLPTVTLAVFVMAPMVRITRTAMRAAMASDFVRTAEAMGLSRFRVVLVYGLGNALLPVLTLCGTVISTLLGASVLVEKVFAWPGIGSYSVDALMAGDFAAVQGFVLMMAGLFVLMNLAIDLCYRAVDPRVSLA